MDYLGDVFGRYCMGLHVVVGPLMSVTTAFSLLMVAVGDPYTNISQVPFCILTFQYCV